MNGNVVSTRTCTEGDCHCLAGDKTYDKKDISIIRVRDKDSKIEGELLEKVFFNDKVYITILSNWLYKSGNCNPYYTGIGNNIFPLYLQPNGDVIIKIGCEAYDLIPSGNVDSFTKVNVNDHIVKILEKRGEIEQTTLQSIVEMTKNCPSADIVNMFKITNDEILNVTKTIWDDIKKTKEEAA